MKNEGSWNGWRVTVLLASQRGSPRLLATWAIAVLTDEEIESAEFPTPAKAWIWRNAIAHLREAKVLSVVCRSDASLDLTTHPPSLTRPGNAPLAGQYASIRISHIPRARARIHMPRPHSKACFVGDASAVTTMAPHTSLLARVWCALRICAPLSIPRARAEPAARADLVAHADPGVWCHLSPTSILC